jgi:hypothetical protein
MSYTSEIHMPIETIQDQIKAWHFFDNDNTGGKDYRLCTIQLDLPSDQKAALNNFIKLDTQGRALPFQLTIDTGLIGAIANDYADGFYPFGPDLYAVGNPTSGSPYSAIVQPISHEQGGALWQPFRWFDDKLCLLLVSPLSASYSGLGYNLGRNNVAGISQGPINFGPLSGVSAQNLMFPHDGFKPKSEYNYRIDTSLAGLPHVIDTVTDYNETSFEIMANLGNAARLIWFLEVYARSNTFNFSISSGIESYPFGADWQFGTGSYPVNLLGADKKAHEIILKITHESYNTFKIPLSFWLA